MISRRSILLRQRRWFALAALLAGVPVAGSSPLAQGKVAIRVGTIVPEGSPWHEILRDMGQKWRTASNGRITWTIYPGGTLGDEAALISKMRQRQIHVAAVTSVGLETIAAECSALSIPLLFESDEELDYVRQRIEPRLEKALEAKGFIVLNWGDGGWIRFFTVRPVSSVNEFRKLALFTWAGSPATEETYKDAGFRPIPMAPTEILQSLKTGKIQAFPAPPLGALAFQWFGAAKNMIDMKFAPIIGATIMTRETWERFEPPLREALKKEAEAAGERLKADIRKLDDQSIAEMKKYGLNVVTPSPAELEEWRALAQKFYGRIRGAIVQPADFDEVMALVKQYRAGK